MHLLLQGVPIFAGLDDSALELLLSGAEKSEFASSAVIVTEGEHSNRIFVIESGKVRICKNFGESTETDLAVLGPKEFFGEMCILETLPRAATAQALVTSSLVSISSMAFHRLYQRMPAQYSILILNIARDLSRRLRHLDEVFAARQ